MAEANMIDSHCHEIAEEIAKLLPEKEDQAMRVLAYLREVVEKHFAEAAVALPPALTALLSVVEVV
jgi:ribosomal protein L31E